MEMKQNSFGWPLPYPIDRAGTIVTGGSGAYANSPDFQGAVPPRAAAAYRGEVDITMSGTYYHDFRNADARAAAVGMAARTNLWTWHHVYNMAAVGAGQQCSMQLVTRAEHNWSKNHYGSCRQWKVAGFQPRYQVVADRLSFAELPATVAESSLRLEERNMFVRELGFQLPRHWEELLRVEQSIKGSSYKIWYSGEEGYIPADGLKIPEICFIMNETQEGALIKEQQPEYYPFAQDVFGNSILGHGQTGYPILTLNHESGEFNEVNICLETLLR